MARDGSFSGELDIQSPADEFLQMFTSDNTPVSSMDFSALDMTVKCDWKDLEKRTVTLSIFEDLIWDKYKPIKVTFTVTPKEDRNGGGSRVAWTVEFEKIRHVIDVPMWIINYLDKYFKKIDDRTYYTLVEQNRTIDSIGVKSPADECFKGLIEAFKDDARVEIEAEDWEKRTATIRMTSSHILMKTKYKMLKVTTTITPKEDSVGSHVKWTIESEKMSEDNIDPDLSLDTAWFIREMVDIKLRKMNIIYI